MRLNLNASFAFVRVGEFLLLITLGAVHLLDVVNWIFDRIHEVELLLELMINGANPLVVEVNIGCNADEADARPLWIRGANQELLSSGILDVLERHFVHLKRVFGLKNPRQREAQGKPTCMCDLYM
jgi:hypothetical protein